MFCNDYISLTKLILVVDCNITLEKIIYINHRHFDTMEPVLFSTADNSTAGEMTRSAGLLLGEIFLCSM